jgi:hypothetical protein
MSKNQLNDQGYNSVMKEYDFYNNNNNNIDDFEIIDEIPTNYINPTVNEKNEKDNTITNSDQKDKLQNFVIELFKIIFYSRNLLSEFSSKSRQNLTDIKKSPFSYHLEELIAYDDLKDWADKNDNKKKKYVIEFFICQKNSNDLGYTKKVKDNNIPKLLVEKWKIKYKEKFSFNNLSKDVTDNKKKLDDFIKTNMKIIEKSVILYSHILPLFNICRNKNYYVKFEFNPTEKNKPKFLDKNKTKKVKIIKEEFFDFKISVTYFKFELQNLNFLIKKSFNDFVIVPSKKSRLRFLSDDYNKKSKSQLLKKESKDGNNENNNKIINDLIIDNYINNPNSNEKNNQPRQRRFSLKERQTNPKIFESEESEENEDSEEQLDLVLSGSSCDFKNLIIYKVNQQKNQINNNKGYKKSHSFNDKKKHKTKKENILKNYDFKNSNINKIVKEYNNMKNMIKMMPNYGYINCDKLSTFISSN